MLKKKILNYLLIGKEIEKEEYEVYAYGLEILLLKTTHIVCIVFIGLIFHKFIELLSFLLIFSLLRRYAKGFHASTKLKCLFVTIALSLGCVYFLYYAKWLLSNNIASIVVCISSLTLILFCTNNSRQLIGASLTLIGICLFVDNHLFIYFKILIPYSYVATCTLSLFSNIKKHYTQERRIR